MKKTIVRVISSTLMLGVIAACGIDTDPNRELNEGTRVFKEEQRIRLQQKP